MLIKQMKKRQSCRVFVAKTLQDGIKAGRTISGVWGLGWGNIGWCFDWQDRLPTWKWFQEHLGGGGGGEQGNVQHKTRKLPSSDTPLSSAQLRPPWQRRDAQTTEGYFSQFCRLEVQVQGAGHSVPGESSPPSLWMVFSLCPLLLRPYSYGTQALMSSFPLN